MPSGVGARLRAARAFAAITLIVAGLAILAAPAGAQEEPGTITINKVTVGGVSPATFQVTGPGIDETLQSEAGLPGVPSQAEPALPPLAPETYVINETAPADEFGQSVWELTDVTCDTGQWFRNGNGVVVTVAAGENITCTFTDTVTRSTILGQKVVTGDTSSWVRPARFHITCPDIQLDIDIEPPVGPGGPGTYIIGQGSIPPVTCTISETDTGSDGPVIVSMFVTNNGVLIAGGGSSVTFTAVVGGNLVLTVTNQFPGPGQGEPTRPGGRSSDPGGQGTTTTTIAGGGTTTTTTTTIAGGGTTTATTVPGGGGATTTTAGSAPTSAAAATTVPDELPTTGRAARGLIVVALASMVGGVFLIARTRRPAEVRVEKPRK